MDAKPETESGKTHLTVGSLNTPVRPKKLSAVGSLNTPVRPKKLSAVGSLNTPVHLKKLSVVKNKKINSDTIYEEQEGVNPVVINLLNEVRSDHTSTTIHEGYNLFFNDGKHRIDFILAWDVENFKKLDIASQARRVFESNLLEEGLLLEYDLTSMKNTHFLKVHAPYVVLRRYADILKLRVPIKEARLPPAERRIKKSTRYKLLQKLLKPCQYNKSRLPLITRSYTCPYSSNKEYLFEMPRNPENLFSNATRSWIVDYILRRKYFADNTTNNFAFGINKMLTDNYYSAAYPLHEGRWENDSPENSLKILYDCWACWKNFYKFQPIDHIRLYFGETVALYFAWLGFYTSMLIPAMIVGLIVFFYGLFVMLSNTVSDELCDVNNNIIMCPLCDISCTYWKISDTCLHAKVSRVFDNGGTVFFAVFMSLWGTFFLEFWKRTQATIQYKWDLTTFVEEEQPPRPEYLSKLENMQNTKVNLITGLKEPHLPFWRRRFPKYLTSYSIIMLLAVMALAVVLSLIANRIAIFTALNFSIRPISSDYTKNLINKNASLVTTVVAAVINLIIILILNYTYGILAFWLTDWECLRTQNEYDNSITFKLFVLQFINYFSSIFYIAFIKGQFTGRPGKYITLFGNRQEECDPGGCLIEVCLQLGITMVGKQMIHDTLRDIVIPYILKFIKTKRTRIYEVSEVDRTPWGESYLLTSARNMSLFYEYLEMVIQFGFLTIFCAAFPLGPLFAFLNNVMEIRVDATKFTTQMRRPVAAKSASIGIWYSVLYAISRIAIITNAFIIVTTSEFIPRLMYSSYFSKDGSLKGYVNFTLSYFNTSDYMHNEKPHTHSNISIEICRYKDFRNPPSSNEPYIMSVNFWHIQAARLAFVCIFENVIVVITSLLSWVIPDIPSELRKQIHREAYMTNEIVLATELKRARGEKISNKTSTCFPQIIVKEDLYKNVSSSDHQQEEKEHDTNN